MGKKKTSLLETLGFRKKKPIDDGEVKARLGRHQELMQWASNQYLLDATLSERGMAIGKILGIEDFEEHLKKLHDDLHQRKDLRDRVTNRYYGLKKKLEDLPNSKINRADFQKLLNSHQRTLNSKIFFTANFQRIDDDLTFIEERINDKLQDLEPSDKPQDLNASDKKKPIAEGEGNARLGRLNELQRMAVREKLMEDTLSERAIAIEKIVGTEDFEERLKKFEDDLHQELNSRNDLRDRVTNRCYGLKKKLEDLQKSTICLEELRALNILQRHFDTKVLVISLIKWIDKELTEIEKRINYKLQDLEPSDKPQDLNSSDKKKPIDDGEVKANLKRLLDLKVMAEKEGLTLSDTLHGRLGMLAIFAKTSSFEFQMKELKGDLEEEKKNKIYTQEVATQVKVQSSDDKRNANLERLRNLKVMADKEGLTLDGSLDRQLQTLKAIVEIKDFKEYLQKLEDDLEKERKNREDLKGQVTKRYTEISEYLAKNPGYFWKIDTQLKSRLLWIKKNITAEFVSDKTILEVDTALTDLHKLIADYGPQGLKSSDKPQDLKSSGITISTYNEKSAKVLNKYKTAEKYYTDSFLKQSVRSAVTLARATDESLRLDRNWDDAIRNLDVLSAAIDTLSSEGQLHEKYLALIGQNKMKEKENKALSYSAIAHLAELSPSYRDMLTSHCKFKEFQAKLDWAEAIEFMPSVIAAYDEVIRVGDPIDKKKQEYDLLISVSLEQEELEKAIAICRNPPRTVVTPEMVAEFKDAHQSFNDKRNSDAFKVETVHRLRQALAKLISAKVDWEKEQIKFEYEMATVDGYEAAKKLAAARSPEVREKILAFNSADSEVTRYSSAKEWGLAIPKINALKKATAELIQTYNRVHNNGAYQKKCSDKLQKFIKKVDEAVKSSNEPTNFLKTLSNNLSIQLQGIKKLLWDSNDFAGFDVGFVEAATALVRLNNAKEEYKSHAKKLAKVDELLQRTLNIRGLPGITKNALEAIRANIVKLADAGDMIEANRQVDALHDHAKAVGRN